MHGIDDLCERDFGRSRFGHLALSSPPRASRILSAVAAGDDVATHATNASAMTAA